MKDGRRKTEDGKYGKDGAQNLKNRKHLVLLFFLLSSSVFHACGKKAPPLAPLNMAPEAPQDVSARRLGDNVYIRMKVPAKNAAGRGPYSVDRLEVYAVTTAPGTPVPPNRDLLKPPQLVTKIPVRPPPDPDAPEEDESEQNKDTRPRPGDVITFVEKLTDAQLAPKVISAPPKPEKAPTVKPQQGSAASAAVLSRTYVVRGVAKNGNLGATTPRIDIPLLAAPGPPRVGDPPSWDEKSVTIHWNPPAASTDEVPGVLYNIYSVPASGSGNGAAASSAAPLPLNPGAIADTSFVHQGAEPGKQQCFVVRSVATVGTAFIESDPSDPMCVTPKDTFPPAAPKGLVAVADTGAVNLVWDSNGETDLAGYLVLRGEAPGDNMQPLMPQPIQENRYTDRAVKAGVTYFYAVLAVDKAGNRSQPSNRVQETGR